MVCEEKDIVIIICFNVKFFFAEQEKKGYFNKMQSRGVDTTCYDLRMLMRVGDTVGHSGVRGCRHCGWLCPLGPTKAVLLSVPFWLCDYCYGAFMANEYYVRLCGRERITVSLHKFMV